MTSRFLFLMFKQLMVLNSYSSSTKNLD